MDRRSKYEELEQQINTLQIANDEIRRAKRAIKESETLHRLSLEKISDTVIITDDHGKIIYACPSTDMILGLSQNQVYERGTIQELISGSACDLSELRKVQEISNLEWTVLDQSGQERFLLITAKLVSIMGGTVLYSMRDITERKKMELELILREREYRTLVESLPDLVVRYDLNLRRIYVNPAWERASGLSAAEVINVSIDDISRVPTPAPDEYVQRLRQVLETGAAQTIEFSRVNTNGVKLFLDYVIVPEYDRNGKIARLLAVGRDITKKKQIEEALRKSEQKWQNILINIPQIGISLDPQANIVFANEYFLILTGWRKEEIIGKNWFDLFIPENNREEVRYVFNTIMSQKDFLEYSNCENEIVTKTGELRNIQWSNVFTKDAQGNIADVTSLGVDLTERRVSEKELLKQKKLFETMFNTISDGVIITNKRREIQLANKGMESTFGYKPEDLLEKSTEMLYADQDKFHEIGAMVFGENAKKPEDIYVTYYRDKNGREFPGETFGAKLFDENNRWIGNLVIARDITEHKQAEEEICKLNETLEQRVAERTTEIENRTEQLQKLALELSGAEDRERQYIASILHDDFQQQLAYIKMELDQIRKEADTQVGPRLGLLSEITGECIEKSRNLSYELNPPALHRSGLFAALDVLAKDIEKRQGLEVTVRKKGAEPTSLSLSSILYRSARELLYNVIKHAGVESALMDIRNEDGLICLKVEDLGNGFDFDAVRAGQDSGAGFGLYNIEDRMAFLGGSMKVKTKPGKGCRVVLTVPKDVSLKTAVTEAPLEYTVQKLVRDVQAAPIDPIVDGEQIRVLLADDHKLMREALSKLLQDHKELTIVGEAVNGNEAVQLAAKLKPHVILMDVTMPELDGFEATAQITGIYPDIQIIALSMHNDPDTQQKMFNAGASAYLTKTDESDTLVETIRRVYHGTK